MKKCPQCQGELAVRNIGPVEVDECDHCSGIWFDKDELRQTRDQLDMDLNWLDFDLWTHPEKFAASDSARQCPVCQVPLVTLHYGKTQVNVDYCRRCHGTWLEKGEFKKMMDRLEDQALNMSLSDYLRESVHEAREIVTGPESRVSEWKDFGNLLRMMQYRLFVEKPGLLNAILNLQKADPF